MLLQDRVALVAGVGPGLGRAVVLALAREGAGVVMGARSAAALDELAAEVTSSGGRAVWAVTDVTDPESAAALVQLAEDTHGALDVVVVNAFTMGPMEPVVDGGFDGWRDAFEVNVMGALHVVVPAADLLARSTDPSVVLVNSQAARRSQPRRGAYSATKAALLSVGRTLAGELGPHGIRVNSVVPGQIGGAALDAHYEQVAARRGVAVEEVVAQVAKDMALRRIPGADEVADAVVLLASPLARAVTGQSLDVNAGNWFE